MTGARSGTIIFGSGRVSSAKIEMQSQSRYWSIKCLFGGLLSLRVLINSDHLPVSVVMLLGFRLL